MSKLFYLINLDGRQSRQVNDSALGPAMADIPLDVMKTSYFLKHESLQ